MASIVNVNTKMALNLPSGEVEITVWDAIYDEASQVIGNPRVTITKRGKLLPVERLEIAGSKNLPQLLGDTAYAVAAVLYLRKELSWKSLQEIRMGERISLRAMSTAAGSMVAC